MKRQEEMEQYNRELILTKKKKNLNVSGKRSQRLAEFRQEKVKARGKEALKG